MNKEELLARIAKKEKDIEKIQKRIAKWSKGLRPEDIAVCEPFGNCIYGTVPRGQRWADYHGTEAYQAAAKAYREYKDAHEKDIPTSDDWSKGPNIGELRAAYVDLGEARNTLNNYKLQIEKMDNFEKAEKIKVIWDFLTDWENKVYNWYLNNAETYFKLKQGYEEESYEALVKWENENPKPDKDVDYSIYRKWDGARYRFEKNFEERYYSEIDTLTKNLINFKFEYDDNAYGLRSKAKYAGYDFDTEKLKELIKKEKQSKYEDMVNRVTSITGPITDASNLSIGNQRGELNGIIIGENGKARVETISAGGYNTDIIVNSKHGQRFHYRVIINEVH